MAKSVTTSGALAPATAKKAKISTPVMIGGLAGLGIIAYLLIPQPDEPKKMTTKTIHTTVTQTVALNGITDEDIKAHFDRYASSGHDAFLPLVVSTSSLTGQGKSGTAAAMGHGTWSLTGITEANGLRSALVENGTTNESQFLKEGDRWNGQRVVQVADAYVLLANEKGQQTQLTFPVPPADKSTGASPAPGALPGATPAGPGQPLANTVNPAGVPATTLPPPTARR